MTTLHLIIKLSAYRYSYPCKLNIGSYFLSMNERITPQKKLKTTKTPISLNVSTCWFDEHFSRTAKRSHGIMAGRKVAYESLLGIWVAFPVSGKNFRKIESSLCCNQSEFLSIWLNPKWHPTKSCFLQGRQLITA